MGLRWNLLLVVLLGPVGWASAQTLGSPVEGMPTTVIDCPSVPRSAAPRIWGSAEYLLWWTKSAPLPIPVVTTGSSTDPALGALGGATTQVAIGNENLGFNLRSGGRFALGGWLDCEQRFGVEGNFLFISSATVSRTASVDGFSPQVISVPFIDRTPGGLFGLPNQENGFVVGAPVGIVGNGFAGITTLSIKNQLLGAEANALLNLVRTNTMKLDMLGGFRYLYFREQLEFDTSSPTVVPVIPGEFFTTTDHFDGRNDFYGGQIGTRLTWDYGKLNLAATAKVAMGVMHQQLNVNGSLTTNDFNTPFGTGPGQSFPGGYFALPSNIGEHARNRFAVVPEAGLNLNYRLTPRITLSAGYTFIYLSSVVRPSEQLNRNINGGQSSLYSFTPTPTGLQGGPALPTTTIHGSDFWTQGVNLGFEFRF
jgi:Putative beta barrel porin-7 (BBP7)